MYQDHNGTIQRLSTDTMDLLWSKTGPRIETANGLNPGQIMGSKAGLKKKEQEAINSGTKIGIKNLK